MKENICMFFFGCLVFLFAAFLFVSVLQGVVDICRWINYRTEIQQMEVARQKVELEIMKARLEKIKEGKE